MAEEISSLLELEALSKQSAQAAQAVTLAPKPKYDPWPWSFKPSDKKYRESFSRFHEIYDTHELPKEITISPHLARFLVDDHTIYQERVSAHRTATTDRAVINILITGLSSAYAAFAPNPHSLAGAAKSWVSTVSTLNDIDAEYKRLLGDRNQIARHILELYRLTEKEDGSYSLQRGHWDLTLQNDPIATGQSRGVTTESYLPELCNVGVDPKLDVSKLPNLPSKERDGPT